MRTRGIVAALAGALLLAGANIAAAESPAELERDGSVTIAGHKLKCGNIRTRLDARLQNLGIAVPDRALLVINPVLLGRQPQTVRLFVFHHECGHHFVGGNELRADCWAVEKGVRDGWFTKASLKEICRSFGNTPETPTHPASARRCAALDRCFAGVQTKVAAQTRVPETGTKPATPAGPSGSPPLSSGPTLLRSGVTYLP